MCLTGEIINKMLSVQEKMIDSNRLTTGLTMDIQKGIIEAQNQLIRGRSSNNGTLNMEERHVIDELRERSFDDSIHINHGSSIKRECSEEAEKSDRTEKRAKRKVK